MKQNNSLIGIAIGVVGISYGLYSQSKMNKVAKKIDLSIDSLDTNMNVNIPQIIIDTAINKAVDRGVSSAIDTAVTTISSEITSNMRKEVKQSISVRFNDISEQISVELADQVSKIDKNTLSDKVAKKAEQKIIEKLDGVVTDASKTFHTELKNMGKVYSSMMYQAPRYEIPNSVYFKL